MKYLFLTDDPKVAKFITHCGVQRVFLDLETLGKAQRQGGRDTVMSQHRRENISAVKAALTGGELLVRTNPLHAGTASEVEYCIDAGADLLMVPMVRSARDVATFCRFVRGRVPVVPLVETYLAVCDLKQIVRVEGVAEIHIGLNDLHLDLGLRFLFEVVANGIVDRAAESCRETGTSFGVGGIATLGGGLVPGEWVLGEYVRMGSSAVILSRAFHQRAKDLRDLQAKVDLPRELAKLAAAEVRLVERTDEEIERDRLRFKRCVADVVAGMARAA